MQSAGNILLHILVLSGFAILYILAWILLQPTVIHRKRKFSTLFLKISYLIYLAFLLAFVFFLTFYKENPEAFFTNLHFTLILFSAFIPTVAMFARRRIKKGRSLYNLIFTGINLLIVVFLVILYLQILAFSR
ncbi:MAG: hypothetical protein GXO83_13635 [Chlorobi bacterium]|nr:hypothetical protein [Chlorobiota bacterium]